jgi:hypothetical protein
MSSRVGIIANPASGKDIRRLVSHATVVNNHEKVSIVRRVLVALHAAGVEQVDIMPDPFGIGARALDGLRNQPEITGMASIIEMPFDGSPEDSTRVARWMRDAGAGCIVVLGGDGTCRVVAKGCGDVPLMPISTGTNNVVPHFVEGTIAGLAAAYVALHPEIPRERLCLRHKRLFVHINGQEVDQALVEVALVSTAFVGARAIWEINALRQIYASRAQPTQIGLSSIAGMVRPVAPGDPVGAMATIVPVEQDREPREQGCEPREQGCGGGRYTVIAPIAPGTCVPVDISEIGDMEPGILHTVCDERPAILALDGEREIRLRSGDRATVTLQLDGPWIVDVERTLAHAVARGEFVQSR